MNELSLRVSVKNCLLWGPSLLHPIWIQQCVCVRRGVCRKVVFIIFFLPIIHCWCAHTWSVGKIFALAVPLFCGGGVELDAAPHSLCPFPHIRSPASPVSGGARRLCLVLWLFHQQHILKGRAKIPTPVLHFRRPALHFLSHVCWRFAVIDVVRRRSNPSGFWMTSATSLNAKA